METFVMVMIELSKKPFCATLGHKEHAIPVDLSTLHSLKSK